MRDFKKEDDTILVASRYGTYSRAEIEEMAESIIDKLAREKVNYEEAMMVLRSSEEMVKVRAKLTSI
ncbi:MAG TPA: hypothetical protein DDY31_15220 [Lachnospiraceae bacterium]|nr:hypothetical protein [Lachnospiraceae bacterium]